MLRRQWCSPRYTESNVRRVVDPDVDNLYLGVRAFIERVFVRGRQSAEIDSAV